MKRSITRWMRSKHHNRRTTTAAQQHQIKEHAFSMESRRLHTDRLRKTHVTTSTLKSNARKTRGGATSSRRSFSVRSPGGSENCGSAELSSRRPSMPLRTSRSAPADISFSPTTKCVSRVFRTGFQACSATSPIQNAKLLWETVSRGVESWLLPDDNPTVSSRAPRVTVMSVDSYDVFVQSVDWNNPSGQT